MYNHLSCRFLEHQRRMSIGAAAQQEPPRRGSACCSSVQTMWWTSKRFPKPWERTRSSPHSPWKTNAWRPSRYNQSASYDNRALWFYVSINKLSGTLQERVNLARKIEKIEYYNNREKQHDSWFKQAAEALEVDLDDDLLIGKIKLNPLGIYSYSQLLWHISQNNLCKKQVSFSKSLAHHSKVKYLSMIQFDHSFYRQSNCCHVNITVYSGLSVLMRSIEIMGDQRI